MINFKKARSLQGGYSTDLTNNVERPDTYQKGIGGRLYSDNGVVSFSGGKGTKLIYQNTNIVKYLGYESFTDEMIVFAKVLKTTQGDGEVLQNCVTTYQAEDFVVTETTVGGLAINFTTELTDNYVETETCSDYYRPPLTQTLFNTKVSCLDDSSGVFNNNNYYGLNTNVPNRVVCNDTNDGIPVNNLDYFDAIYSFKLDDNYVLNGSLLWVGTQNWPLDAKITTVGVLENDFYKRVYYTDGFGERKVVNIKDKNLRTRNPNEFQQVLNNVLIQPRVSNILDGGSIKASSVQYVYRVIGDNGQLSQFSPTSELTKILYEDQAIEYRGGDISELTTKQVEISIDLFANSQNNGEIECIAIEYETNGIPTSIRNLGRQSITSGLSPFQDVRTYVFKHIGNEAEIEDNITLNDIIELKNQFKYANDFATKKNKLIAGGLRNKPLPDSINNLEYLFPLHSWNNAGTTHNCLINPEPWNYRYIDPTSTANIFYIKSKVYRTISSLGNATISLTNKTTSDVITLEITDLLNTNYTDILSRIITWLLDEQTNNVNFTTYFPNLTVSEQFNELLFSPTDDLIKTDMLNYEISSNNVQFLQDFDTDIQIDDASVNVNNLVHGAVSVGFNQGTGLRVTYREFKEPLANQRIIEYTGFGNVIDYIAPSGEKYCMKGEIYRLGFQAYQNDSTQLFTIPLGDVMVPALGDLKSSISDNGDLIITNQAYINQSVEDGVLYGHGIKMHIEVRLNCDLQKTIPMYQIAFVERTEDNRTILCQGISQPLTRNQDNGSEFHRIPDALRNTWTLSNYGGPTYQKLGLENYDDLNYGPDYQYTGTNATNRTVTHRALMYFDSPDLYFNKISDKYIQSSKANIVARLKTDHTEDVIRHRPYAGFGNEVYPKFSCKILEDQIEGNNNSSGLPNTPNGDATAGDSVESHFINVSVYAQYEPYNSENIIDKVETLERGEVISGAAFQQPNDVSNNAGALASQPWFYNTYLKRYQLDSGEPKSELIRTMMTSPGYRTTIIKTEDDLFTPDFVQEANGDSIVVESQLEKEGVPYVTKEVYQSTPLINIVRNNRETVYGGRTSQDYSRNVYIPLSKTIPTLRTTASNGINSPSNDVQYFDVGADTYVTLNIRTKNDYGDDEIVNDSYNHGNQNNSNPQITVWTRNGAWVYAVVLETSLEPKDSYQYEFYKNTTTHSFSVSRPEIINSAYLKINDLKSFVPKPYNFKDDPTQPNVIAVSDVKLSGEYYDSWVNFKPNNFYAELEENKGVITNLILENDQLYAIQEQQTSILYIGTDRLLTDQQGAPINVQQGTGTVVEGHKVISQYGTSFRRAVSQENSDFPFVFFDERKVEFVKEGQPLLLKNLLHLEYYNRHKKNKIIDTEAYYDQENKETCIRIRCANNENYLLSYNELEQKFNGEFPIEFDKDLFMSFDNKMYAPITTINGNNVLSSDLHELNDGDPLNYFGVQTDMILGLIVNADIDKVFQYKQCGIITNIDYPVNTITGNSNLGYDRVIKGTHEWYKIREGIHTVPMINDTDEYHDTSDIRGNWVYIEINVSSLNKNKVNILAVINDLRYSHQ